MDQEPPDAPERADESTPPVEETSTPAEPPQPPLPLVAWQPQAPALPGSLPPGLPPPFTIGGILTDSFARYGADPIRLFAVGLLPAVAGLAGGFLVGSQPLDLKNFGSYILTSLILGLVAGILGLISASITFALLEVGPDGDGAMAVRWGFERLGWLLGTGILLVLALFAVSLIVVFPASLLFRYLGPLSFIVVLIAMLVFIWLSLRLILAIPAVVVDRLNTGDAMRLSWAVTKPSGVWGRLGGAFIVMGLLVGPASFLAGALASFDALRGVAAIMLGGLVVAFLSPLTTAMYHAAYRRLVVSSEAGRAAGFTAPKLGNAGRALIAASIAFAVVGCVSVPVTMNSLLQRQLNGPGGLFPGNVPVGTVAFGIAGDLRTCTVLGQITTTTAFSPVVFMGHLQRPATPSDEVRLRITLNGTDLVNEVESPGAYSCLGTATPETDIAVGIYEVTMLVNGAVSAHGALVVQ